MADGVATGAEAEAGEDAGLAGLPFYNMQMCLTAPGAAMYSPESTQSIDQALHRVPGRLRDEMEMLRENLLAVHENAPKVARFAYNHGEVRLRVAILKTDRATVWVALRRIPPMVPTVEALSMDPMHAEKVRRWLRRPGLTLVVGTFGAGKTWTSTSFFRDNLEENGGFGIMMECPIEFSLTERVGSNGLSLQLPISETDERQWSESAANVRKANPHIIMIGEIANPASCLAAVGLADTGRPVIATTHGGDHTAAIQNLATMADQARLHNARNILAERLTGIMHQTLERGRPTTRLLDVADGGEALREAIRSHDDAAVMLEVERQHLETEAARPRFDDRKDGR